MKPLSIVLLVLFALASLLFVQSRNVNDTGFVLSIIIGLLGAVFVIRKPFSGAEPAGQVFLGIAISLIAAALFGFPLIGGAIAGAVVIVALNGGFR